MTSLYRVDEAGRVHRLGDARGAKGSTPAARARAFDKPGTNRGTLPSTTGKGKYHAIESSDEGDFTQVLVMKDNVDTSKYHGISVNFMKNGRVSKSIADRTAQEQWDKDEAVIVATARQHLKKKQTNESKTTFKAFILREAAAGWYVMKGGESVAGPYTSQDQADGIAKNKGGDAEGFTSEYVDASTAQSGAAKPDAGGTQPTASMPVPEGLSDDVAAVKKVFNDKGLKLTAKFDGEGDDSTDDTIDVKGKFKPTMSYDIQLSGRAFVPNYYDGEGDDWGATQLGSCKTAAQAAEKIAAHIVKHKTLKD